MFIYFKVLGCFRGFTVIIWIFRYLLLVILRIKWREKILLILVF